MKQLTHFIIALAISLFMVIILITCVNNIMSNIKLTDFYVKLLKYITLFTSVVLSLTLGKIITNKLYED